jgi:hypothetical protein
VRAFCALTQSSHESARRTPVRAHGSEKAARTVYNSYARNRGHSRFRRAGASPSTPERLNRGRIRCGSALVCDLFRSGQRAPSAVSSPPHVPRIQPSVRISSAVLSPGSRTGSSVDAQAAKCASEDGQSGKTALWVCDLGGVGAHPMTPVRLRPLRTQVLMRPGLRVPGDSYGTNRIAYAVHAM